MKAAELRASILQEAVSGKLVPQIASEGTADELLKQIEAERAALIKAGKLKKEKLLPEITEDEIPFEIPKSWKWVRLGKLLSIKSGDGLTQNNFKNGDIPVYGGNGIVGYHDKSNTNIPTIIIGRVGFYCGSIHQTKDKAWITDNAFITSIPHKSLDINYLEYSLRWINLGEKSRSTAQPVISGRTIYPCLFPLPPLSEQKRIVAKLEEILPLIDQYGEEEEKLSALSAQFPESMRKSILQEAVSGKLVPQIASEGTADELLKQIEAERAALIKAGKIKKEKPLPEITEDNIPFEIPKSWKWVRLASICAKIGDGIHGTPKYDVNGPYYFINGSNLVNGSVMINSSTMRVSEDEAKKYYIDFNKSTLFYSINGTIGNYAYYDNERIILGKSAAYLNVLSGVLQNYVMTVMKSHFTNQYADNTKSQTTIGNLSLGALRNMPFPLPPLSEQKRIVAKIEEMMSIIDKLRE